MKHNKHIHDEDYDINIKLISQTSDEISIILGIDEKDFEKTINVIYKEFIK